MVEHDSITILTAILVLITAFYAWQTRQQSRILRNQMEMTNKLFHQAYEPIFALTTGNFPPTSSKASLSIINSGSSVSDVIIHAKYTIDHSQRSTNNPDKIRIAMIGVVNDTYYSISNIPIKNIIDSLGYLKLEINYHTKIGIDGNQLIELDFADPEITETSFPISIEREHKGY